MSGTLDDLERLQRRFEVFVEDTREASPLYSHLSRGIARDPALLALARYARSGQPAPNMLFSAVHYLLLAGVRHPLSAYYPDLPPAPQQWGADPLPAFADFCHEHAVEIREILRTRLVQTNEVRRCACLVPGLAMAARDGGSPPLALIEIGTSAGLNLLWDEYGYTYTNGQHVGEPDAPVRLETGVRGARTLPLPERLPRVSWRVGIDLHPVDVRDDDAVLWLRALIWPEHADRVELLGHAVANAREHPPRLIAGNALDVLPGLVAEAPEDATLVLMHSFVLNQFSVDDRARLHALLGDIARRREVVLLGMEYITGETPTLTLAQYGRQSDGTPETLARCEAHGRWIEWTYG